MSYKELRLGPMILRKKDFMPIAPQRYVWHVCGSRSPQVAASIERFGLLARSSNLEAVFANNQSDALQDFYPFVLDNFFYSIFENHGKYLLPSDEDIWRIDTFKCGVTWYMDPNMYLNNSIERYIFTLSNIPRKALCRYRALPDSSPRFLVRHGDGVSSVIGPRLGIAPYPWREDPDQLVFERAA